MGAITNSVRKFAIHMSERLVKSVRHAVSLLALTNSAGGAMTDGE
jgi:hypothetical protein